MNLKFDYNSCIEKGLLKKIPPSKQKAEASIKTAHRWLEESKKNFDTESYNSCLLSSYLAMFHAARSILWRDGYREKSHACIARYLDYNYVRKGLLDNKWVNLLDFYRDMRHNDSYSVEFHITNEECNDALNAAKNFVNILEKLLNSTS